jgi:3-oxoacyl-[acyl-carrier protein] reductase
MKIDLTGKVALVTGGARGIGAAIVHQLHDCGATVIFNDYSAEMVESGVKTFAAEGINVSGIPFDVSDFEAVQTGIKQLVTEHGGLDILVNNAGITRDTLLMRMKEADWDMVMDVNLKGVYNLTKHAVRYLLRSESPVIVNISSVIGVVGNTGQSNYAASKAGVIGFSKSMAKELAGRKVRVNVIAPGYIETEMTSVLPEQVREEMLKVVPLGRPGQPQEIAQLTAFLASDASGYITGQVIQLDGGMYI